MLQGVLQTPVPVAQIGGILAEPAVVLLAAHPKSIPWQPGFQLVPDGVPRVVLLAGTARQEVQLGKKRWVEAKSHKLIC